MVEDQAGLQSKNVDQDLLDGVGEGDLGDAAFLDFIDRMDRMLIDLDSAE